MGFLQKLFGGGDSAPAAAPAAPAAAQPAKKAVEHAPPPTDPIPMIEESEAEGELKELYEASKQTLQLPVVPNLDKVLGNSPPMLEGTNAVIASVLGRTSIPGPVVSMVLYSIAAQSDCNYCGSFHKLGCRTLGVDEATLTALSENMADVTPERVQAIVAFAVKSAKTPTAVGQADYDALREMGISDAEIVEIVTLAALGVYLDVLADALKVDVDEFITQGLEATAA